MILAMLAGGLLFAAQGFGPAPQPAPITTRTEVNVTVQPPPVDPVVLSENAQTSFQGIFVGLIAPTMVNFVNGLLDIPDIYRQTPPALTYDNPAVRSLAEVMQRIAFGGLLLLLVAAVGLAHFWRHDWTALAKPIIGTALASVSLLLWQFGIQINNAINNEIAAGDLQGVIRPHLQLPSLVGTNPAESFSQIVIVVAFCVVALLLLGSIIFRLALLNLLIVLGPIALLCKGSEQTEWLYSRYVSLSVSTLFGQVLMVLCLKLAPVLGAVGTGLIGTLASLALLWLARRSPSIIGSAMAMGGGSGVGRVGAFMLLRRVLMRF